MQRISLDKTYALSDDIVVRNLGGAEVLVPISGSAKSVADGLYSLNDTGQAILSKLSQEAMLSQVVQQLALEFGCSPDEIESDVCGFMEVLLNRGILREVP